MIRIAFVWGAIAGSVVSVVNTLNLEYGNAAVWLGLLVMFIVFLVVPVVTRRYRDETLGGVMTFWQAFALGAGVSVVAATVYVAMWEVYLFFTDYGYIESLRAVNIPDAEDAVIANETKVEAEAFARLYANPLIRLPMTFVEILPAGLLVTLLSAASIRRN